MKPLGEMEYVLPIKKAEKPGEYTVTVSFHLKEDTIWAKAGHEVAFGQYVYMIAGEKEAENLELEKSDSDSQFTQYWSKRKSF